MTCPQLITSKTTCSDLSFPRGCSYDIFKIQHNAMKSNHFTSPWPPQCWYLIMCYFWAMALPHHYSPCPLSWCSQVYASIHSQETMFCNYYGFGSSCCMSRELTKLASSLNIAPWWYCLWEPSHLVFLFFWACPGRRPLSSLKRWNKHGHFSLGDQFFWTINSRLHPLFLSQP